MLFYQKTILFSKRMTVVFALLENAWLLNWIILSILRNKISLKWYDVSPLLPKWLILKFHLCSIDKNTCNSQGCNINKISRSTSILKNVHFYRNWLGRTSTPKIWQISLRYTAQSVRVCLYSSLKFTCFFF